MKDAVLVVTVLRGLPLSDAPVRASLEQAPTLAVRLYDNGGGHVSGFLPPSWCLIRDRRNPGVGPRYLDAARQAISEGRSYLLLLDQDFHADADWWRRYEEAVARSPEAVAWAPRLRSGIVQCSPMRLRHGCPRGPACEGNVPAHGHLALNSGLLVRAEEVVAAEAALLACPLDFSDYALCWSMGRRGGEIAPVALELGHELSSHRPASPRERLARFQWFAYGARGWALLDPEHRPAVMVWAVGRGIKLALACRKAGFLVALWERFLRGRSPVGTGA